MSKYKILLLFKKIFFRKKIINKIDYDSINNIIKIERKNLKNKNFTLS